MRHLLDKIETRQRVVSEAAAQLRQQIALLSEQLDAAEDTLDHLEITQANVLEDLIAGLLSKDGFESVRASIDERQPVRPTWLPVKAGHG
ncbi:hypothetical protein [Streptomyces sviceus]|uniref:hypothetical protein n=1 Tax=Streptomyces sviceus TaxID=285530 RepID=UPI0036E53EBD